MDLKMGIMDGFEASREIKNFRNDIPIIAQTAYAHESDKEKALNAGCDDYIVKPINLNNLINLIHKHIL
jgi:CheY-like chemotaxis protein